MTQVELSTFEKKAEERARHRALIMQILRKHPEGLTTQQIITKELDWFGYTFLTDNRCRELRDDFHYIVSVKDKDKPQKWIALGDVKT